jgi:hypothetical protein
MEGRPKSRKSEYPMPMRMRTRRIVLTNPRIGRISAAGFCGEPSLKIGPTL